MVRVTTEVKAKPIGLHVHSKRSDDMVERYIREVQPPVMKWLDEGVNITLVKLANDLGILTVCRVYEENQDLSPAGQERMLRRVEEAILRWPEIQAFEGFNEAFQRVPEIQERANFDIKLMKLCERHGKKAVIGSFSVGQPQWPETGQPDDDWAAYITALRRAGYKGHYVGLHEYSAPAMQWGVGDNQMDKLTDGVWTNFDPATRPGVEGYFTLRARKSIRHWAELGVSPLPRVLITESGKDDVQPRPEVGTRRGYKTYRDTEWWDHEVYGDFADQLGWACDRWAEDELIVGGVGFGFADISGDWDDFDLSTDPEMFERVIDVMKNLDQPVDPLPPIEPPPLPDAEHYRSYTVQPGDTYWNIAGNDWEKMLKAVPLDPPDELEVGTVLMIPDTGCGVHPPDPEPEPLYELKVLPPSPHRHHSSRRDAKWLILHDPGVTAPVEDVISALYSPDLYTSYARLISNEEPPVVYEMVSIEDVAWHAGAFTQIPGTNVRNSEVNVFTWSLCLMYPFLDRSYPALVQLLADMIIEAGMPDAGVVLAHWEVSTVPGRRTDPRGIDMEKLRSDIQEELNRRSSIEGTARLVDPEVEPADSQPDRS